LGHLSKLLSLLLASSILVLIPVNSAHSLASNQCKPITDADSANGYDSGDITITPLHGEVFYVDMKNGINASYVGYVVKNDTASPITELWLELSDFRSGGTSVLSLANPADAFQPIGMIAANSNKVQSMSVDDLTPEIGGTVTVTVKGATGTPGSGTSSADGSIVWLSGASSSIWPT
jgi:hypothetical protein